jgi:hypothetical protein
VTAEAGDELVKRLLSQLSEHFETAQVLVSWQEEGRTRTVYRGSGNMHARNGMARDFLDCGTAEESAKFITQALKEDGGQQ